MSPLRTKESRIAAEPERPIAAAALEGGTVDVARRLLGMRLAHETSEGRTVGRIVETEAYLAEGDPASHSANGPTRRNRSMFLPAGHAYVYFIYGVHHCFNVVTGPEGRGEAVLIRALTPIVGETLMEKRRNTGDAKRWLNGPANLVRAMGIGPEHDGVSLLEGPLVLLPRMAEDSVGEIVSSPRIGIRKAVDLPYRFTLA